ncbi:hypothetical protein M407DRAFT_93478 [Tulasnella calospora MUT 4182]|uniref:Uncharacterized protein n=1 Tax=Tulasnella calospora MUT 4182 TaxID=1051891 RepID=A0A0C3LUZ7_9AGAM|nr:hypothetical protein M407DRAFT_93478 [Tulasnella calospora MUT 4182]
MMRSVTMPALALHSTTRFRHLTPVSHARNPWKWVDQLPRLHAAYAFAGYSGWQLGLAHVRNPSRHTQEKSDGCGACIN